MTLRVALVPARLARTAARGIDVVDARKYGKDLREAIRELTNGRGTDAVIDAVGMEAHGAPIAKAAQWITGLLPDAIAARMTEHAGVDRLNALYGAIDVVRRGG